MQKVEHKVDHDLDAAVRVGALPKISLGDLFKWLPVLEQIITAVTQALSTGAVTIPAITIRLHGKHLTLGPIPIALTP